MLGLGLSLMSTTMLTRRGPVGGATPTFTSFGIPGDSITDANAGAGGWAKRLVDNRPAGTSGYIRAQPSRVVRYWRTEGDGTVLFYLDGVVMPERYPGEPLADRTNSLISHLSEDQATGATLLSTQIGTNDMAQARNLAQFREDLAAYKAAVNGKGMYLAFSLPPPVGPNDSGLYADLQARVAALRAIIRDPAVHGEICDYYDPSCEHWVFFERAADCFPPGDDIHYNLFASGYVYESKSRFIYTLLDKSRENATTIYEHEWPVGAADVPANGYHEIEFYVGGIAWKGAAIGISATNGVMVRRSVEPYAANLTERLFNGDAMRLRVPVGAPGTTTTFDLTIGGVTKTLSVTAAVPNLYTAKLDPARKSNANAKLTNNNLTFSGTDFGSPYPVRGGADTVVTTATAYFEVTQGGNKTDYDEPRFGLAEQGFDFSGLGAFGNSAGTIAFGAEGAMIRAGTVVNAPGATFPHGATRGIFLHRATGKVWFRTNVGWVPDIPVVNPDGTLHADSGAGLDTGLTTFRPGAGQLTDNTLTFNFGAMAFTYGPPANGEPGVR